MELVLEQMSNVKLLSVHIYDIYHFSEAKIRIVFSRFMKCVSWIWWHSGGIGRWVSEFKAHLFYSMSYRIARAIQKETYSKSKGNKFVNVSLI